MKCKSILSLTLILSLIIPYTVSIDPSFASERRGQNSEILRKRRNYPSSENGRTNRNRRGTEVNRVNTRTSQGGRRRVIQRVNSGRNQDGKRVTNVQRVNTRTSRDGRRRVIQRVNSGRNQDGKRVTNVQRVNTRTSRDGRRTVIQRVNHGRNQNGKRVTNVQRVNTRTSRDGRRREINRINYPNDNYRYRNRRDDRNYRNRNDRDRNIRHIIRRDRKNWDHRYDENRNNRRVIRRDRRDRDYIRYGHNRNHDHHHYHRRRVRRDRYDRRNRDIIIINSSPRYGYFDSYSHRRVWRNRRYIINPRNRWNNWGWNNGDRWYPNDNYWGGGFWGNFLLEALARGLVNSIVYSSNNNNNYPTYVALQPNSPGYYLFDSYGLTPTHCDQEDDLVYVYGPQDTLVCAYPTETVIAGSYDADPQDLILVLRD